MNDDLKDLAHNTILDTLEKTNSKINKERPQSTNNNEQTICPLCEVDVPHAYDRCEIEKYRQNKHGGKGEAKNVESVSVVVTPLPIDEASMKF